MGGSFIKVARQCQGCSTSNFSWRWHCSPVLFYTSGSDRLVSQGALNMDANSTVKLIAGVLAVVLVGIVILRRKGKKTKGDDDEF